MVKRSGLAANIRDFCKKSLAAVWPMRATGVSKVTRHPAVAAKITLAQQWVTIAALLGEAGRAADQARKLQKGATQQLDLAQYGLVTLRDELSAVMAIASRRDTTAVVHLFEPASDRQPQRALAA